MVALMTARQTQHQGGSESRVHGEAEPAVRVASRRAESQRAVKGTSAAEQGDCDSNYEGACLNPNASDYDCAGGDGNGPFYTGEARVVGVDHFGLDADGDGIGCEAE